MSCTIVAVATRLTSAGVPTLTVAKILGHSSLETTRGYAHHEVESLRVAMSTLARGSRGAIRVISGGKTEAMPPSHICSPLRSHSATRPESGLSNDLPESDRVDKG